MKILIKASTRRTQAKKLKPGIKLKVAVDTFKDADKEWKDAKEACKEVKKNCIRRTILWSVKRKM